MRLIHLGYVIFVQFLTSCAVAPMKVSNDTQGLLMLRVTPNEVIGTNTNGSWESISLYRTDGKGNIINPSELSRQKQTFVQDTLYAGVFEAGEYAFYKMTLNQNKYISLNNNFGQFQIKPGQITYLGHIVQLNDYESNTVLVARNTGFPNTDEAQDLVKASFPEFSTMLDKEIIGWNDNQIKYPIIDKRITEDLNKMDRKYNYIRSQASGYFSPLELPNGKLLFGSLLGTVKHWIPGEKIESYDIGTNNAVATLVRIKNGTILAGGDTSFLSASYDEGKTWEKIDHNLPFGIITGILEAPTNKIYVSILTNNDLHIFSGRIDDKEWMLLGSIKREWSSNIRLSVNTKMLFKDNELILITPLNKMHIINTNTGDISLRALPGYPADFRVGENGEMTCLCGALAEFSYSYHSQDYGVTWKKLPTPKTSGIPLFSDNQHGVILQNIPFIEKSNFFITQDGGNTWIQATPAKGGRLVGYTKNGKTLLMEGRNGEFYYTQDNSQTWYPLGRSN